MLTSRTRRCSGRCLGAFRIRSLNLSRAAEKRPTVVAVGPRMMPRYLYSVTSGTCHEEASDEGGRSKLIHMSIDFFLFGVMSFSSPQVRSFVFARFFCFCFLFFRIFCV